MSLKTELHKELVDVRKQIKALYERERELELAIYALDQGPKKIYPRDVTCP